MGPIWQFLPEALVVAALSFIAAWLLARRGATVERNEELRKRRIDTYATFCTAIVEYRRAQLQRWHVGAKLVPGSAGVVVGSEEWFLAAADRVERERPEVAEDVRSTRATAWSCYYAIRMICADDDVVQRARTLLSDTKEMKYAPTAHALNQASSRVHRDVDAFAQAAAPSVLALRQSALSPRRPDRTAEPQS